MSTLRHICFDRILPSELFKPQETVGSSSRLRGAHYVGKLWPNGSVLRVRFMGGTPAQHAQVKEEANWWTEYANLSFDFNNAPDAQIRISFDPAGGASSLIGTDCNSKLIGLDQPTMNLGFMNAGTVAHEFGHAIGLAHEHQNPAGGMQWNEALVLEEMRKEGWDEQKTRLNILDKYSVDQINGTEFDPQSIMIYTYPGTWVKSGQGMKANAKLSPTDKAFAASLYPKPVPAPVPAPTPAPIPDLTVTDAVELQVNAARGTRASIGQPGEEDLFKFQVTSTGTHIIDTLGPTDVVMKLYGPNSPTALIAEDDDSGVDTNASLSLNLVPGLYYVQIRHSNPDHGTGEYSVQVRRL